MQRIRQGGPLGTTRPFTPNMAATDPESQKADALDHIARALSAIDHNMEVLLAEMQKQTAALLAIAKKG